MQLSTPSEPKSGVRCRNFGSKKLATLKKSWEKPQSVFLDLFCYSELNGSIKFLQKLMWKPLSNLSSLTVRHCRVQVDQWYWVQGGFDSQSRQRTRGINGDSDSQVIDKVQSWGL